MKRFDVICSLPILPEGKAPSRVQFAQLVDGLIVHSEGAAHLRGSATPAADGGHRRTPSIYKKRKYHLIIKKTSMFFQTMKMTVN